MTDQDWRARAACAGRDPALWDPPGRPSSRGYNRAAVTARRICKGCPVREQCLTEALEGGEEGGIWGGLDPFERRAVHLARLCNRAA